MTAGITHEERAINEDWQETDEIQAIRNIRLQRLNRARNLAVEELKRLPAELLSLDTEAKYPVQFSEQLIAEKERVQKEIVAFRDEKMD